MKKNKTMRLASALLVLAILTTCALSATFAKYTSTGSGNDTATVAKWSFKVGDKDIANDTEHTITFDLFSTINDTGNTAKETDVADGMIAPGTSGKFELSLTNASEVNAKYTIALQETKNDNVPLQYSLTGTGDWVDSIDQLNTSLTDKELTMTDSTASQTIYWRWVFEGTTAGAHENQTDDSDTTLGIAAQNTAPTVTITATVTATQVD